MKTLILLFILFSITSGWLAPAVDIYKSEEPTPREKETFAILKRKFGDILDENLKMLHELAESPEYNMFLAKTFKTTEPIPEFAEIVNFEKVLNRILPPKERYFPYYTEHFHVQKVEEVQDVEHFLVHHEATYTWIDGASDLGGEKSSRELPLSSRAPAQLMSTHIFRNMLETRFGINAKLGMSPAIMTQVVRYFNIPILRMTKAHLVTDAQWIATLFEKYGTADGMLWIAIQNPILFERMRYAFSTKKAFLTYVHSAPIEAEAEARRLLEIRKQIELQKEQSNQ